MIDMRSITDALLQAVPLWGLLSFIIIRFLRKTDQREKDVQQRLQKIELAISLIQQSIQDAGINDMKHKIEQLNEFKTKSDMNIKALWRVIDPNPRKSDS